MEDQENKAIVDDKKIYGNPTKAVPVPEPDIGLEDKHSVVSEMMGVSDSSQINTQVLNGFLDTSKRRDNQYDLIDQMCNDSIPAAILELCTEDTVTTNEDNNIVWVTSDNPIIQKSAELVLKSFQVNKNIPKWANSLIKYGDVYLKLFKKSEYDPDPIFKKDDKKKLLKEDIKVHLTKDEDHFVSYAEMVDNPATMYELTRLGKTAGFIQTHLAEKSTQPDYVQLGVNNYRYTFKQQDIDVYEENKFVHGSLDSNVDRISEEVEIIRKDPDEIMEEENSNKEETKVTYKVRSGRSFFYSAFRVWRIISLLQNSLILNRLTKSSIVRIIQMDTGNQGKEEIQPVLQALKEKIEQTMALNPGQSMSEYNDPGPVVNTIYLPKHGEVGAITTDQIGGDYDPKQLTDIDYFNNILFGTFGIPKQFMAFTDDGAGFNGGQSLTILSSRYAKKIIKIQQALIEMLTTLVNIIFMDRNLSSYINKFTINMQKPLTQEDLDRTEAESNTFRVVSDTLSLFSDVEDKAAKLKILKALIPQITDNAEILKILEEEIAKLEKNPETSDTGNNENNFGGDDFGSLGGGSDNEPLNLDDALGLDELDNLNSEEETGEENIEAPEESGPSLPTPGETGVDLVNGTGEEEI